jgi:hypothetical protein
MPAPPFPERAPIGDSVTGVVIQANYQKVLALAPQEQTETILNGTFVIRYGIRYLEKPFLSIVPGLVALDYGDLLTGEDAWQFLTKRSNLHPRADVFGYRNDGQDEMIVVKRLDFAQPVDVLVYADETATKPSAQVTALIAASTSGIPQRILDYLPYYASVAEWLHE